MIAEAVGGRRPAAAFVVDRRTDIIRAAASTIVDTIVVAATIGALRYRVLGVSPAASAVAGAIVFTAAIFPLLDFVGAIPATAAVIVVVSPVLAFAGCECRLRADAEQAIGDAKADGATASVAVRATMETPVIRWERCMALTPLA